MVHQADEQREDRYWYLRQHEEERHCDWVSGVLRVEDAALLLLAVARRLWLVQAPILQNK